MGKGFVSQQTRTIFFCEYLSLRPDPTALKSGFSPLLVSPGHAELCIFVSRFVNLSGW